jgi:xylulokinase
MRVYLGLDASTQSLSAVLIGVERGACRLLGEHTVDYDRDLPQYGTRHGVIRAEDGRVEAPPRMWAEALDVLMARLASAEREAMARLAAVSGAAQQHGSVYLTNAGLLALSRLDPGTGLTAQLASPEFARQLSPVWLDASTGRECEEIERAAGGRARLEAVTGARAFDRFTGPQIRAFARRDPAAYAATARVHLVSSFLASLLAGADAPVEASEGSGTNLMDLEKREWWHVAVDATAPELMPRLPAICRSAPVIGTLSSYWRERYGYPAASIVAWTGDNPSTLIGSGIVEPGILSVSLGTSDTACVFLDRRPSAGGEGYIGASPTGAYLATTTFSNGSLARERAREESGLTWLQVEQMLIDTGPDAEAGMALPWYAPEITPRVSVPGLRLKHVDPNDSRRIVRAVIEGQMLSIARHTRWMVDAPAIVSATGGASVNRGLLQIMADVFGAPIVRPIAANTSALGAALRAWHAAATSRGEPVTWSSCAAALEATGGADRIKPRPQAVAIYARLRERYGLFEAAELSRLASA